MATFKMNAKIDKFCSSVVQNIECLHETLQDASYLFEHAETALVPPHLDRTDAIQRLRGEGVIVPYIIEALSERVGLIDFSGKPPSEWHGAEYPDPIGLSFPNYRLVEKELDRWRETGNPEEGGCFSMLISGDQVHKAGFSGGVVYMVFDGDTDPIIHINEDRRERLSVYIRRALAWGGFPGLAQYPSHNWPVQALKEGFTPLPDLEWNEI